MPQDDTPLMPKATAVWLVDNTSLSFDQIAAFCRLHPLEVGAIADGDAAQGIKGADPIQNGQLTRSEIERGEADTSYRLKLSKPKTIVPELKRKAPRYTPVELSMMSTMETYYASKAASQIGSFATDGFCAHLLIRRPLACGRGTALCTRHVSTGCHWRRT